MKSKFIDVTNFKEVFFDPKTDITNVAGVDLHKIGDLEFAAVRLEPHQRQKSHYHTYADIDLFIIAAGSGNLHLARIENDRVVSGSEEIIPVKEGDTYCVGTYVLHGFEAGEEGLTYLNLAHATHGLPESGEKHRRAVDVFFPLS